jgi:cell division protein FtsB
MRYWESSKRSIHATRKRRSASRLSIAAGGSLKNAPFLRQFYQHKAKISDGLQKFFFFLILALLLYAFVLGDSGAIRIFSLKQKQADLENDIAELERSTAILETEIDHLKHDPFYMEKLGRQYGYVYPGDKVYKLIPKTDNTSKFDK